MIDKVKRKGRDKHTSLHLLRACVSLRNHVENSHQKRSEQRTAALRNASATQYAQDIRHCQSMDMHQMPQLQSQATTESPRNSKSIYSLMTVRNLPTLLSTSPSSTFFFSSSSLLFSTLPHLPLRFVSRVTPFMPQLGVVASNNK